MDDTNQNQKQEDQIQEDIQTSDDSVEEIAQVESESQGDKESEEKSSDNTETEKPEEVAEAAKDEEQTSDTEEDQVPNKQQPDEDTSGARWYVVHTYSGHENRVAGTLKQRVESEHLEGKILDILVPTQEKIEIRGGKKETVKEKIFPGYILVKMVFDDDSWLAVRTTQGVTSFVGMSNKPTPISEKEVKSIVTFMSAGGQPTYKQIFSEGDTVKIVDGPFADFIGKIETVDKEKGKIRVLVSIFGRETPVELDFLQVAKL